MFSFVYTIKEIDFFTIYVLVHEGSGLVKLPISFFSELQRIHIILNNIAFLCIYVITQDIIHCYIQM